MSSESRDDVLRRIRAEYAEMPGLRVTHEQAQRLWGLEARTCLDALEVLISTGFLCKTQTNQYARLTDSPTLGSPFHMAKAEFRRKVSRPLAV